jgi:hypothetical protein
LAGTSSSSATAVEFADPRDLGLMSAEGHRKRHRVTKSPFGDRRNVLSPRDGVKHLTGMACAVLTTINMIASLASIGRQEKKRKLFFLSHLEKGQCGEHKLVTGILA